MEIINNKDSLQDKIQKEQWVRRVERDLKGNPLLKNQKKVRMPSLTEIQEENLKYQDHLGNPIKGYKWEGNHIIKDND
jgi:hypothetical protein